MKLIFKNTTNECLRSLSFKKFEINQYFVKEFSALKSTVTANLITANEEINSHDLSKLKNDLEKLNIKFIQIYSNSRETVVSGKFLKIKSTLITTKESENMLLANSVNEQKDILHKGTIRSGDRISSNGNLFIFGDVNPGAVVAANKNIYVWGKLLGIAIAGENGDRNCSIAALYLNPLQLRICSNIAMGPKEKPKNQYPEIAIIEDSAIIIKPYIIPGWNKSIFWNILFQSNKFKNYLTFTNLRFMNLIYYL